MKVFVGIDIGGSHVSVGFIDENGGLLVQTECDIDNKTIQPNELVSIIVGLVSKAKAKDWTIVSVGVGCPGQAKDNILVVASNLPNFKKVPLPKMICDVLKVPVLLLNDADAAVCAEVWGKDTKQHYSSFKNIVMITLGTGIGCGLILEGRLHQGSNGLVESGHMIVSTQTVNNRKCGCGQSGCVEVFASAKNTAVRLQELDDQDNTKKKAGSSGSVVNGAKEVFDRYAMNDFNAVKVVEETAEHLAILCINVSRVLDPDVIIFSGGMSKAGDVLLNLIRKNIEKFSWTVLPNYAQLCVARSLSSGGVVGTALAGKRYAEQGGGLADLGGRTGGSSDDTSDAVVQLNQLKSWALVASGASAMMSLWGLWLNQTKSFSVGLFRQHLLQLVGSVGFGVYVLLVTGKPITA